LRLSRASLSDKKFSEALNFLHEAHNLGRDNIPLHALTHLNYIGFSLREANYRRALGHLFWAFASPIMVPLERKRRTSVIGEWKPAPKQLQNALPSVAINAPSPEVDAP